jgi:membrane fusion protein (multidrug efflux system)
MKRFIILTITAGLTLGMFSCKEKPSSEAEANTTAAIAETIEASQPIKTLPIELTIIKRTVKITASLVAEEETYLAPAIPGKIRSISVDVNDNVKKGQTLVNMDKSQLSQTRLQYANLKKDLVRMDTLLQYGSITQQAYDQLKTQVNVTKTALANLEENTTLKAPYKGVITGKYYNDGEIFSGGPNTQAGKAAIVSLVKMDVLKVYINLSESYLPLIKKGQLAIVESDVYPNDNFEATVHTIYPTINAATRTFTVELRMDNPDYKLRPGMYSAVTIEMGDRETLLVPSLAVIKQTGTNNRHIFISDGTSARKIPVKLGERVDDMVELISEEDLSGANLIYAGHVNLMDGDKVNLVEE